MSLTSTCITGGPGSNSYISYEISGVEMETPKTANGRTTRQVAQKHGVEPGSLLAQLYRSGSYFGLKPIGKHPNGRLIWPAEDTETDNAK